LPLINQTLSATTTSIASGSHARRRTANATPIATSASAGQTRQRSQLPRDWYVTQLDERCSPPISPSVIRE
jgi:hypothetical protein